MTRVYFDMEHLMVSIQGHAGAGTVGNDIVCAAISILSYAFEAAIVEDEQINAHCSRDTQNAVFDAECYPTLCARENCTAMFKMLLHGLKLIEKEYPAHINIAYKDLRYFF